MRHGHVEVKLQDYILTIDINFLYVMGVIIWSIYICAYRDFELFIINYTKIKIPKCLILIY